jgi:uncharacterized protein YigE (DUF2233 family)
MRIARHPFEIAHRLTLTAVSLLALASLAGQPAQAKDASPCRDMTVAGASYTVCTIDLRTHDLKLSWKAPGGEAYGNLGSFARAASKAGRPPAFAMNAGMYHPDGRPVGLYIEGGQEFARINTARGPGNFRMKPNGVFFLTPTGAGVLETSRFAKERPQATFATQSGPMLVIDGRLHPRFSADGPSMKIRNGVGIRDANTVVFAISNETVSFGAFGRLFRDELKCANALYLDGSISSLWAPGSGRTDEFWPVGPIVSAAPRQPAKTATPATATSPAAGVKAPR